MMNQIVVVEIKSLSYTGTSWLNAVLGSHEQAFFLGPAHNIWAKRNESWQSVCLVHKEACKFWPSFRKLYEPDKNLFVQLSEFSGKRFIITNNLTADVSAELKHKAISHKIIRMVRDGRALASSYYRKFPEKEFIGAITDFLQPAMSHFQWDENNPDDISIRYEELVSDRLGVLDQIGSYLGIKYTSKELSYWKYDHHMVAGNQGIVAFLRMQQELEMAEFTGAEHYKQQFLKLKENPDQSFKDTRWIEEINCPQRFIFDVFCGADNQKYGYKRDGFTFEETAEYSFLLKKGIESGEINLGQFSDLLITKYQAALGFIFNEDLKSIINNTSDKNITRPLHIRVAQSTVKFGIRVGVNRYYIFRVLYKRIKDLAVK